LGGIFTQRGKNRFVHDKPIKFEDLVFQPVQMCSIEDCIRHTEANGLDNDHEFIHQLALSRVLLSGDNLSEFTAFTTILRNAVL